MNNQSTTVEERKTFEQERNAVGIYRFNKSREVVFLHTKPHHEGHGFGDEQAYIVRRYSSEWAHDGMSEGLFPDEVEELMNCPIATEEEVRIAKEGKLTLEILKERGVITPEQFKKTNEYYFNQY